MEQLEEAAFLNEPYGGLDGYVRLQELRMTVRETTAERFEINVLSSHASYYDTTRMLFPNSEHAVFIAVGNLALDLPMPLVHPSYPL